MYTVVTVRIIKRISALNLVDLSLVSPKETTFILTVLPICLQKVFYSSVVPCGSSLGISRSEFSLALLGFFEVGITISEPAVLKLRECWGSLLLLFVFWF